MVQAWLAVDRDGTEMIYDCLPVRSNGFWMPEEEHVMIQLPRGTIEKLIGRSLAWEDEPAVIEEDLEGLWPL